MNPKLFFNPPANFHKLLSYFVIVIIFGYSSQLNEIKSQEISTVAEIYDFEIGDIFHEDEYKTAGMGSVSVKRNITIIDKYYINNNETLIYVKKRTIKSIVEPFPGEWEYKYDTVAEEITDLDSLINGGSIHFVSSYPDQYNGRLQNTWIAGSDEPDFTRWVGGCGRAHYEHLDYQSGVFTRIDLDYFKKEDEEWGTPQFLVPRTFVDPDKSWNVAKTFPNTNSQNPTFVETTTKVYGFKGDTLIGNEIWANFYSTPDSNFASNFTHLGSLREDNGKIFFMDSTGLVNTIYNFNLQIGDSVNYDFGSGNNYLQVENIDSIEVNSEIRKRFYFEETNYPPLFLDEVWIEGIGSIHGPLFPKYPGMFSDEIPDSLNLTCCKLNNSTIWENPFYENCYVSVVLSSEEISDVELNIFPNPAGNYFYIQLDINNSGNVEIYSLTGVTVKKVKFYNSRKIDISELKPGIYILKMNHQDQVIFKKIIKE